jgi:hypothetical protein
MSGCSAIDKTTEGQAREDAAYGAGRTIADPPIHASTQ